VAGFVLASVVCVVGFVLSVIALRNVSRTGARGRGLALAGVVVSSVFIATGVAAGFLLGWRLEV
jgi:hypothetical protein